MKKKTHVPALEKAVAIFNYLEKNPPGVSLSELSSALGIPKSSAHGLLSTLTDFGLLSLNTDTSRFTLGPRFLSLALSAEKSIDLVRIAHPFMQELCDTVNETVKISVRSNRDAVVVARIESEKEYHASTKIGSAFPLHAGAAGKILLAFSPVKTVEEYLSVTMENYTKATISSPEDLRREISRIRGASYAEDNGERFADIRAVACPVFNHAGDIAAALSVAYIDTQNEDRKKMEILEHLHRSAENISAALGYTGN